MHTSRVLTLHSDRNLRKDWMIYIFIKNNALYNNNIVVFAKFIEIRYYYD